MSKINILPEHIANQIAAGEVVEGPNSVIKELVENCLDAGATKIDIDISKNFLKLQVIDNGQGMSKEDLGLAFKKHATSKINTIEDIYSLLTMGFRGEALPSIAAVSKLTCISKRGEDEHAHKIYLENGEESLSQTGSGNGTKIIVDDLFFNTPARLKFLKSNKKERSILIDTTRAFAIANPKIAFSLKIDNKQVLNSTASGSQEQVLKEIFSNDLKDGLNPIKNQVGSIAVSGFCSSPHISRSDKRGIFTIVNGRILQCYIIRSAVEAVYKELLAPGKYPIAIINLDMPSELVDVNVHPNKKEVKYQNTNQIYTAVADAVSKAIADSFYESDSSFQPSFKDHLLKTDYPKTDGLNKALTENSEHFINTQPKQQNILADTKKEAAMEIIESHFDQDIKERPESRTFTNDFSFEENDLDANSQKFVSRLGSADIVIIDGEAPESQISSQGNKTIFQLVIKKDGFAKSIIIKGEFVGENWLKEEYFSFLSNAGTKILEREALETNFKVKNKNPNRSRPNKKPKLKELEEIWERDHYTCVYCSKLLLHPETIKKNLKKATNPDELNEHLASYDHHLPASKFPSLNEDSRNLYACCQACNIQKSDSLASKTWEPKPNNAWQNINKEKPVAIAGINFNEPC